MNQINENTLLKAKVILLALLSIFTIFYTINTYREGNLIGANASNTITVSGKGETEAKPDTATISFTIRESAKDAKQAEKTVAEKSNKAVALLKDILDEKYIKTNSYTSYPKYIYPANAAAKIDGYETTQTVEVKVKDISKVSDVIQVITSSGINEVSGPNYIVDKNEDYMNIARGAAIKDAKDKASVLASQLGVKIVRIVSFTENNNSHYPPMYASMSMKSEAIQDSAPSLPVGENIVTSNVSVTYEIK
jgi:uncharacterized protein